MDQSRLADILRVIYSRGQISRVALAQEMDIAPSYISSLVRELIANAVLRIAGVARSSGGRPGKLLQINPDLAHLIGIDIGTVNCRMVVTDFLGKILGFKKFRSQVQKGQARLWGLLHEEIRRFRRKFPGIKAIGVGQSGVIDRDAGTLLFWPKVKGWNEVPIRRLLEDEHGLPTIVEDSTRSMAVAEQTFGQGRGLTNFVHVTVGMGIGAAIFVGGSLYSGSSGSAGELGHITIDENGILCSCGNRGCLEVYSSGWAIIGRVRSALSDGVTSALAEVAGKHPDDLSVEMIVTAAKSGDRLSQTVLSEAGEHLGTALAGVVNLFNPEKIILGGATAQAAGELLLHPLFYSLKRRALQRSVSARVVVTSELDEMAAALGATVMLARELLPKLGLGKVQGAHDA